ncbi:MAG: TIGR03960 family B12-binding radical SAM protein [Desulfobacteraceae bacterium]|jgi:radical SAM family uncharacterized protein/radical SAM-linked protein|nr:TIGR03960 family B12-binding radical SAM protein [Desulfobacteraceae bacterium]
MCNKSIQEILPFVEKPSRYLGFETNVIKKDPDSVKLRMALAFPDLYEIGTSHFGIQILYHILNKKNYISVERVYAPGVDMEKELKNTGNSIFTLESHEPLNKFDIIGFSLLYELNYTNILTILDLADIPFLAEDRDESHPILIAGGPSVCNPEPVADLFDVFVIGDGEEVVLELSETWVKWKESESNLKEDLLKSLSKIKGVYIPSFFEPVYDENGFQKLIPKNSNYKQIQRVINTSLRKDDSPDSPVIPFGRPVHDRLRLEIARGCSRGCRFCQAGMIYRPVRERSMEDILDLIEKTIKTTGYDDISLLSLSTGDYSCISQLIESLVNKYLVKHTSVSLPSLRADTLTPGLINYIKKVRKTGFTIAPEAGSQRLRNIINKNISRDEIINTVNNTFNLGWDLIKLYFMIGLPGETEEDLKEIVEIVKDIKKIKGFGGRNKKINISITTFVPKPHTPFQWSNQISIEESKKKISWLKRNLKFSGVKVKNQDPETSQIEGLFSRGDRRLCRLIIAAYKNGCRFDGWSDSFDYSLWKKSIIETGLDDSFFINRERGLGESLPWSHINIGLSETFLKDEYTKAISGELTKDCRKDECNNCGICDFDILKPDLVGSSIVATGGEAEGAIKKADIKTNDKRNFLKYSLSFSKKDKARYFGHLELVNIFLRAIKRAGINVKYTEGFHPKPKISFEDTLPLGIESEVEVFTIFIDENQKPKDIITGLNNNLVDGINVYDCKLSKKNDSSSKTTAYYITLINEIFDNKKLEDYLKNEQFIIYKTNKKGRKKEIDLKTIILHIDIINKHELKIVFRNDLEFTVRPIKVIENIFDLSKKTIKQAKIIKFSEEVL